MAKFFGSLDDNTSSPTATFLHGSKKLSQKMGTKNCLKMCTKNVCIKVSLRLGALFCRIHWNGSACRPIFAASTQLFSQALFCHTPRSCLEILSTTNNLCTLWRCNLPQVKSAPKRFAARTIYLRRNRMQFSQQFAQAHRIRSHVADQYLLNGFSTVLKQPSFSN